MISTVKNPAIEIHDLTVSYDKKPVLWDVDISLPKEKLIGIVGPNGAGKSTLFKAMMNIIPLDSGYVKFFNQTFNKVRKQVSYVPQRFSVDWQFPATVEEIVMMGRYVHMGFLKRPKRLDKRIVTTCLDQVRMTHLAKRQIGALSGGQQQLVFLARALAQEADIYLLDEALAEIDASTEALYLEILQRLTKNGKTVLLIHHSLEAVKRYCDYIVLLNMYIRGAGPIEKVFNEKLLQDTYSHRLNILSNISNLLHQKKLPTREKNH